MKKIIIIMIIVVVGYVVVGNKVVEGGVDSIKNHNAQLEEVMNSMD